MAQEFVPTPITTNHVNITIRGVVPPSITDNIHKNAVENGPGSTTDIIIRIENAKYLHQTKANRAPEMKLKLASASPFASDGNVSADCQCVEESESAINRDSIDDDVKAHDPAAQHEAMHGNGGKPIGNQFEVNDLEITEYQEAIKECNKTIKRQQHENHQLQTEIGSLKQQLETSELQERLLKGHVKLVEDWKQFEIDKLKRMLEDSEQQVKSIRKSEQRFVQRLRTQKEIVRGLRHKLLKIESKKWASLK